MRIDKQNVPSHQAQVHSYYSSANSGKTAEVRCSDC